MVRGKGGWLRIVEATIAILLIIGAILIVSRTNVLRERADYTEKARNILDEISTNNTLRAKILSYDIMSNVPENNAIIQELNQEAGRKIAERNLGFNVKICKIEDLCYLEPFPANALDIYTSERIISTDIVSGEDILPRKFKIFLWRVS